MFNQRTADRLPIAARVNVSPIDRVAMDRAKKMLAQLSIQHAAAAVSAMDRQHHTEIAIRCGAVVTVSLPDALHTIDDSTSVDACGKVAQVVS